MIRQSIELELPADFAAEQAAEDWNTPQELSRRAFVKRLGLGAAAAAGCAVLGNVQSAAASSEPASDEAVAVLIDLTRCSGCQSCALACKVANNMPQPETVPSELDSRALSYVETHISARDTETYIKHQCMNCVHPACVSACTVGALSKTATGPVVYDSGKCIGCRYCQYACPFGVPTYEWDNVLGLIRKCEFCYGRLGEGEKPACVAACPNGALRFGKRKELLAQAKAQIASVDHRYVNHIYGEHEVGGTSMLYLSDISFAQLGFPTLGSEAISGSAETVMQLTPAVAATVATVATGLHLILRRRQQVAEFNQRQAESHSQAHTSKEGEE